jgi:hypothetical protein
VSISICNNRCFNTHFISDFTTSYVCWILSRLYRIIFELSIAGILRNLAPQRLPSFNPKSRLPQHGRRPQHTSAKLVKLAAHQTSLDPAPLSFSQNTAAPPPLSDSPIFGRSIQTRTPAAHRCMGRQIFIRSFTRLARVAVSSACTSTREAEVVCLEIEGSADHRLKGAKAAEGAP